MAIDVVTLALAKQYTDTKGIPDAVAADEGKVLTVDNTGAPAWKTPRGGGGERFVVNFTSDNSQTPAVWSTDKDAKEIYDAWENGSDVIANIGDSWIGSLVTARKGGTLYEVCFSCAGYFDGTGVLIFAEVAKNGTRDDVVVEMATFDATPAN